jgi:hypothetical protein
MRDIDESKEPSSDDGLEGIVSVEGRADTPADTWVSAAIDGAGGIITEDAARDSSLDSSGRSGSATLILEIS